MKSAGRMKPKRKARESHDEFYSPFAQWEREAKAKQKESGQADKQIPSHEPRHARGMQLGSAASMISLLYEIVETTESDNLEDDESEL